MDLYDKKRQAII